MCVCAGYSSNPALCARGFLHVQRCWRRARAAAGARGRLILPQPFGSSLLAQPVSRSHSTWSTVFQRRNLGRHAHCGLTRGAHTQPGQCIPDGGCDDDDDDDDDAYVAFMVGACFPCEGWIHHRFVDAPLATRGWTRLEITGQLRPFDVDACAVEWRRAWFGAHGRRAFTIWIRKHQ